MIGLLFSIFAGAAHARPLGLIEIRLVDRAGEVAVQVFVGPDEVARGRGGGLRLATSVRRRLDDIVWIKGLTQSELRPRVFVIGEGEARGPGFALDHAELGEILGRTRATCRDVLFAGAIRPRRSSSSY